MAMQVLILPIIIYPTIYIINFTYCLSLYYKFITLNAFTTRLRMLFQLLEKANNLGMTFGIKQSNIVEIFNEEKLIYILDHKEELLCRGENCKIIIAAALATGNVFASLRSDWKVPTIDDTSTTVVASTFYKHPTPQCRFDTFLAGSICSADAGTDFDNEDYKIGSCVQRNEPKGARPACWFAPDSY